MSERDDLSRFRDAYLDYLEGARGEPPALEELHGRSAPGGRVLCQIDHRRHAGHRSLRFQAVDRAAACPAVPGPPINAGDLGEALPGSSAPHD